MGQKVHPIGFRIAVNKDWRSRWFAAKPQFRVLLHEDLKIRAYIKSRLFQAAIARIQIERFANRVRITLHSARPAMVFSRKNSELDTLKADLVKLTNGKDIYIDIVEIRKPEIDSQLVAESIALQMERRIGFRRAMKKAISTAMDMGAQGIKVRVSGRLNNAELARTECYKDGKVPLHTLRAPVEYGFSEARTVAGAIGVKVWICMPENAENNQYASYAKASAAPKGAAGKPRRKRPAREQA